MSHHDLESDSPADAEPDDDLDEDEELEERLQELLRRKDRLTQQLKKGLLAYRVERDKTRAAADGLREVDAELDEVIQEMDDQDAGQPGRPADPDSVPSRVREFLDTNNDAAWTSKEISDELKIDSRGCNAVLATLANRGHIRRVHRGHYKSLKPRG